jgi:hypothetical protein
VNPSLRLATMLLLTVFLVYLPACHLGKNLKHEPFGNEEFMSVWQTYTRCISSSDVHSTLRDSLQLRIMSHAENGTDEFKLQPLNTRLAVDIKAMSASCTLHAGDVAATSGLNDTARDMFIAVLDEHSEPLYAYYAEQARARLHKLGTGLQASLLLF